MNNIFTKNRILAVCLMAGVAIWTTDMPMAATGPEEVLVKGADLDLYAAGAAAGDGEAMRCLAVCYQTGTGVAKDLRKAWEWYGKAAAEGNVEAQYAIGTLYRDGIGTSVNYKESAYWFRKAASNGNAKAMINIARQFEEGKGVLADNRIAAENYWRAAERGENEGAYKFACMLRDGKGVGKDLPRALKYFEQAAASDYKDSRVQVNALIAKGVVCPSATKSKKDKALSGKYKSGSNKTASKRGRRH